MCQIKDIVNRETRAHRFLMSMSRTDVMEAAGKLDTSLIKEFILTHDDKALGAFFRNALEMHSRDMTEVTWKQDDSRGRLDYRAVLRLGDCFSQIVAR